MSNKIFYLATIVWIIFGSVSHAQQSYYVGNLMISPNENGQLIYKDSGSDNLLNGECKLTYGYYSSHEYDRVVFVNGMKEGKETHYHKEIITGEFFYKDGLLDGDMKEFGPKGIVTRKVRYVKGKIEGPDTYYFSDGAIQREVNYKNGVLNGHEVEYDENTRQIKFEATYKNGLPDGNQFKTEWNSEAGDLIIKSVYKNGILTDYKEFYITGELFSKKALITEDKSINYSYRKDGSLISECAYKGTLMDGKQVYYYPDGKTEVELYYKSNYRDGLRTEYFPDGIAKSKINYTDGQFNGLCETFYPNGKKQSEINYRQNYKYGPYKIFFDNGQLREEGEFDDAGGNYYDAMSGYLYQKTYYKNGRLNSYSANCNGIWTVLERYEENEK